MNMKRNPDSPWNPADSVEVTPKEYEDQVYQWLLNSEAKDIKLEITKLEKLHGSGGGYELDCLAIIELFGGAIVKVVIECKRYSRPVEREKVLALQSKMIDIGAHKAIMFSTSGFQKGAIEYSKSRGIALITFIDGSWLYETRSVVEHVRPPAFLTFPKFAGIYCEHDENLKFSSVTDDRKAQLTEFLVKTTSHNIGYPPAGS